MKKYKLLKDLPLAEAGTICEIRISKTPVYNDLDEAVFEFESDSTINIMNCVELHTIREKGTFDEWFEEIDEGKLWKPGINNPYNYIMDDGTIESERYDDDPVDRGRVLVGNVFKNAEDAEKVVKKLKALKRLRDKGMKFENWDWKFGDPGRITLFVQFGSLAEFHNDEMTNDLNLLFKEGDNE